MSSILTDVKPDGRIMWCIALENFETSACGFEYMHGKTREEIVNKLLVSKSLKKGTRVAWIAPAIGVKYDEPTRGDVKEVFV